MTHDNFYKEISDAIINLNEDKALELANQAINDKLDILEVVENGFGAGIRHLGELWDSGEFYLPELMYGAKIIEQSIDILLPHLKEGQQRTILGKVAIATIENDIHSIGKTIVGTMLSASGFEVYDLGADVPAEKIIEARDENGEFVDMEELLDIEGVDTKLLRQLKKYIKIEELDGCDC